MAQTTTQLGQDPQYDPFLCAPIGEDHRGSSVTVLSMLSRLGVDPWNEASALSRLPRGAATQRLKALMARFTDVSIPVSDRDRIVEKILTFLPRPETSSRWSSDGTSAKLARPSQGSRLYWIVAAALVLGLVAMLAQG
ncbi:hypothetical protein [Pseudoruegeria sp. SK021]|uniref:hypothetical protein n=1 Tax=Pseudoruegeria sp. SK021 TaxID=1933035 RepID=UPI000A22D2F0|nr:hypothetical protein [Pseudoruegeria sp. SK021]OSP53783.1 hypothetical protein BV911_16160 [Pseudoruegeria sp. SK021]